VPGGWGTGVLDISPDQFLGRVRPEKMRLGFNAFFFLPSIVPPGDAVGDQLKIRSRR
jgi:hypothetical protein